MICPPLIFLDVAGCLRPRNPKLGTDPDGILAPKAINAIGVDREILQDALDHDLFIAEPLTVRMADMKVGKPTPSQRTVCLSTIGEEDAWGTSSLDEGRDVRLRRRALAAVFFFLGLGFTAFAVRVILRLEF